VIYGDNIGVFSIATLEQTEGDLPQKAIEMVQEWGKTNQDMLKKIWDTHRA
jgi:hypothetical protein